jgi:hypothetical protein
MHRNPLRLERPPHYWRKSRVFAFVWIRGTSPRLAHILRECGNRSLEFGVGKAQRKFCSRLRSQDSRFSPDAGANPYRTGIETARNWLDAAQCGRFVKFVVNNRMSPQFKSRKSVASRMPLHNGHLRVAARGSGMLSTIDLSCRAVAGCGQNEFPSCAGPERAALCTTKGMHQPLPLGLTKRLPI